MDSTAVRSSLAAACLAAPPVALALIVAVMLVATALGWRPLWPQTPLTPAEAVLLGDDAAFVRLVAAGADPNGYSTAGPRPGDNRALNVTPLEAAVIRGREQELKAVMRMGATITGDTGRRAVCLAYEESPELVPALWQYGAPRVEQAACGPG